MSFDLWTDEIILFPCPSKGKVEKTITPTHGGRVEFEATYWPAEFYEPTCRSIITPDHMVMVVGRKGITLLVVPLQLESASHPPFSPLSELDTSESSSLANRKRIQQTMLLKGGMALNMKPKVSTSKTPQKLAMCRKQGC